MALACQHRAGLRLTHLNIDEISGAAPIDQCPEGFEFGVSYFALAAQHIEPTLEDGAEARVLPALNEGAGIGFLLIR